MSKWNKISSKIPKINTYVHMLGKDFKEIGYGKLVVFLNPMNEEGGFFDDFEDSDDRHNLTEGDVFWKMYGEQSDMEDNVCWDSIENFPYWITEKDLIEFMIENKEKIINDDETGRFDILDL